MDSILLLQDGGGSRRIACAEGCNSAFYLVLRGGLRKVDSRRFRNVSGETLAKAGDVVRIDMGFVGRTGDGDVRKPGVDEATRALGVEVGKHTLCSQPL